MIPEREREKYFLRFCSGEFKSIRDFAERENLCYTTVYKWVRKYNWRQRRKAFFEKAVQDGFKDLAKNVDQINQNHLKAWDTILGHALLHLKKQVDKNGQPVRVDADVLLKIAQVIRLVQAGQRLALGADTGDEPYASKVEVVYGRKNGSGELAGGSLVDVAHEMVAQYREHFNADELLRIGQESRVLTQDV